MANAQIDENDVKTWILYNETTGLVERAQVDPVTGVLLVFGVATSGNTPTALYSAKIDGNDAKTKLGYNETTSLVEALRCGNSGELLLKS